MKEKEFELSRIQGVILGLELAKTAWDKGLGRNDIYENLILYKEEEDILKAEIKDNQPSPDLEEAAREYTKMYQEDNYKLCSHLAFHEGAQFQSEQHRKERTALIEKWESNLHYCKKFSDNADQIATINEFLDDLKQLTDGR